MTNSACAYTCVFLDRINIIYTSPLCIHLQAGRPMGVNFRINLDSLFVFCKCPTPGVTEEGLVVNSMGN